MQIPDLHDHPIQLFVTSQSSVRDRRVRSAMRADFTWAIGVTIQSTILTTPSSLMNGRLVHRLLTSKNLCNWSGSVLSHALLCEPLTL